MKMSPEINELAKALVQYQKVKKPAKFDSKASITSSRSYKYASLGSVDDTASPMSEYGLSYSMFPVSEGWYVGVDAILMHESGQWLSERFMFPLSSDAHNPAQQAGAIITYARRYALSAILGITADEDIDAGKSEREESPQEPVDIEAIIAEHWNPLAKLADELKIEFEPLPPDVTEEGLRKRFTELKKKVEGAK